MNIIKLITSSLLTILPVTILIRDWKFHDKRTKKHHKITRTIVILWFIGSVVATIFVWHDSVQIKELIDGKNILIVQNKKLDARIDKLQITIDEKGQKIKKLQEKIHKEEMIKMESIETKVDKAINTEIEHYIEEIKTIKDGKTNRELYSRKIILKNKSINPKTGIDIYIKCDKKINLSYVWSKDIAPITRKGGILGDGKTCDLKVFSSIPPKKELSIGLSSDEPFNILEIKYD